MCNYVIIWFYNLFYLLKGNKHRLDRRETSAHMIAHIIQGIWHGRWHAAKCSPSRQAQELEKRAMLWWSSCSGDHQMKIITTLQQCEGNDGTLRNYDNDVLKRWLTSTTSQTSATMQNKLLMIMAHMVLRDICQQVGQLAVTVDARRMSSDWSRMLISAFDMWTMRTRSTRPIQRVRAEWCQPQQHAARPTASPSQISERKRMTWPVTCPGSARVVRRSSRRSSHCHTAVTTRIVLR